MRVIYPENMQRRLRTCISRVSEFTKALQLDDQLVECRHFKIVSAFDYAGHSQMNQSR